MARKSIKLDRLPNRKPVKLTITLEPETLNALQDYARIYAEEYGDEESIQIIAAYMIDDFMEGDTAFKRKRKSSGRNPETLANGRVDS